MGLLRTSVGGAGSRTNLPVVGRFTTLSNLVFVGVVSVVTWFALSRIEQQVREDAGQALDTVLETSHSSVSVWSQTQRAYAEELAGAPEIKRLTEALLRGPHDAQSLLTSSVLVELRSYFTEGAARHDLRGFFIIAPDGTSLASMRDANVGTRNLIAQQRPDVLERALRGSSALVPPLHSDVPLPDAAGLLQKSAPTMFVLAPIFAQDGTVRALLALRLDPLRDFSRLAELARVGESGETYAFDSEGRLLTDSRFAAQLRAAGLLAPEQSPILGVTIADPGRTLDPHGFGDQTSISGRLTHAASEATAGRAGRRLDGYADYRNVEVIGSWLWDHDLGIGLVSEIDEDEALRPYYATRGWFIALLATAAVLSTFLTWLVHWIRGRGVRELADREDRLRAVLDTTVDAIMSVDADGRVTAFNQAAERIFGYREDEVCGRGVSLLLPPTPDMDLEHQLRSGAATTPIVGRELRGKRKDGGDFPVELGLASIPASYREGPRFTAVLRDMTERKELERQFLQSQKMEAVGHLAAGVAHDFNNLLMGVSGSAKVGLRRLDDRERVRSLLEEIHNAAATGAAITRQLLTVTRTRDSNPVDQELDPTIERDRGMLSRLVGEDVRLRLQLDAAGAWLRAGDGSVEQVLINLVVNARDAMPHGGELTIATRTTDFDEGSAPGGLAPGSYLILEVRDTGVGMDEETRQRIFEPFFTTKEPGKGTGLGLSTVFGIVRRTGGRTHVESKPGVGTTFRMYLPRREAPVAAEEDAVETKPPLSPLTVLVVEDEPLVRDTVAHFLRAGGHRVLSASGRREAREVASAHEGPIDVLITDVVLRGDPGVDVARDARTRDPGVDVVYVSAHPEEYLWDTGRLPQGTPVLQKPFGEFELDQCLRKVVASPPPAPSSDSTAVPHRAEPPRISDRLAILLVEDQDSCRDVTAELLEDEGFEVLPARNGAEAEQLYAQAGGRVVVVTDFGLPDTSGPQLVDRLGAEHPLRQVIYVSGRSEEDPEVQAAVSRVDASFLAKPIDVDDLVECLRQGR